MLVLHERKSRVTLAARLIGKTAAETISVNGVAERFIRTLKENLLWVRTFDTIEDLRAALVEFATRYNETWLVARRGYKTPAKVRSEQTMPQLTIDPRPAAALLLAACTSAAGCFKPGRSTRIFWRAA